MIYAGLIVLGVFIVLAVTFIIVSIKLFGGKE